MKRIVVSGGTGYIGSALVRHLVARGDAVTVLTRGASHEGNPRHVHWDPYTLADWTKSLEGCDAVVNLVGEQAVGVRFTAARKKRLRDSRVIPTQNIVAALASAKQKPEVLVSVSGIGFYGDHGPDERLDETFPPGSDFLARLCVEWEAASHPAEDQHGIRVINPRMGIVLGPGGGALQTMALPFKLFVGGAIGSGKQGVSWVALDDAVAALTLCIDERAMHRKVNVCSPNPVSNGELSRVIAKALGRPCWLPVPGFALRLLFGEGAEPLLTGQFAVPRELEAAGFRFEQADAVAAVTAGFGS